MAKTDVLDILRSKKMSPLEFNFESLWIPPMHYYLSPQDVESLRQIATSVRLSSKIQQKYKMIDDIMRARGFKRFSAGTNRVVYSFFEDTRFLVKIAVDKVGMQDNPLEYENQFLLKPYVTKMFYISPCGTVGFAERVLPVKNKAEFKEIAPDVFDIIVNKILGKYVVEDVGTKFFMNWGIRMGFGPVLLDYPYVYKLDGKKLFCTKSDPITNTTCDGEIDYDVGFNHLVCTKCGKRYLATNLRDNSIDNTIIIKGGIQMRVILKKGEEIISTPIPSDDVMERPTRPVFKKTKGLVVCINNPDGTTRMFGEDTPGEDIAKPISEKQPEPVVESSASAEEQVDDGYKDADNEVPVTTELMAVESVNGNGTLYARETIVEAIEEKNTTPISDSIKEAIDDARYSDGNVMRDNKGRFISKGGKKSGKSSRKKNNRIASSFIPDDDEY